MEQKEQQKVERIKHDSFEQGSSAWHEFRKTRIGGSEAASLCGISPWLSSLQLFLEKTGKVEAKDLKDNFAVQRGVRLEPYVRGLVCFQLDADFEPVVFTDSERPYMSASLDGWDEEKEWFIEIKVGNAKDHKALKSDDPTSVPEKYAAQLQHQLHVTKAKRAFYCSYWVEKGKEETKGDLKIVEVSPLPEFIKEYLPIVDDFHNCLVSDTPPSPKKLKP